MLLYNDIKIGNTIYIIEISPSVVLKLEVIGKVIKNNEERLRLQNTDLSFEVNYNEISETVFATEEEASAVVFKKIYDETNIFIEELSDGLLSNYYELEERLKEAKISFPEKFI